MGKILAVIKREYFSRVRSRGFVIWTILTPVLGAALLLGPAFFSRSSQQNTRVVVLDQSGDAAIFTRADKALSRGTATEHFKLERVAVGPGDNLMNYTPELNRQINAGELTGYLILPPAALSQQSKLFFHTQSLREQTVNARLRGAFNTAVIELRLAKEGLQPERVGTLMQPVEIEVVNSVTSQGNRAGFFLALAMLTVLYGMIIFYGNLVMRGVIEEKQSRIVEVLLSSINPFALMLGKLIGIGLVSLTQVVIWAVSLFGLSVAAAAPGLRNNAFTLPQLAPLVLVFFLVFFVLGYFLFSTLYLIVGAMVSAEEDAQQLQMPVMLSVIAPMLLLEQVMRQPNSLFSIVMSLVPLFSPILMFGRIAVQTPPGWQIGLAIALLLLAIWGAVWLAAKIYRVGVLMYGKPPTLPELFKWLKYS